MVLNFQISFRAVLGLSSQLNFESFTIFCPYLGANSMFDVANVSKVSKLSFRGKILSKIGGFHFFFSQPEAGLTNQGHVWHCDTRVPLRSGFIRALFLAGGDNLKDLVYMNMNIFSHSSRV